MKFHLCILLARDARPPCVPPNIDSPNLDSPISHIKSREPSWCHDLKTLLFKPSREVIPFTSLIPPHLKKMSLQAKPKLTASAPSRSTSSEIFRDAMVVRTEVFVQEQGIPAENEFDDDDERSIHWVVYANDKIPVGAIRLVPSPHAPHDHPSSHAENPESEMGTFFKLGRIAASKKYRGLGIGRMLVNVAVQYATENPGEVGPRGIHGVSIEGLGEWDGRCLVHAQTSVQGMWAKSGFVIDETMGEWDEEGIMHVGMWRDLRIVGT